MQATKGKYTALTIQTRGRKFIFNASGAVEIAFAEEQPPSDFKGITYPAGIVEIAAPTGLGVWLKANSDTPVTLNDGVYNKQRIIQEAIQKAIREAQLLADSPELAAKLAAKTNIGTTSSQGHVINTSTATLNTLEVINNYLTSPLTTKELQAILDNRDKFTFKLWVGDRRTGASLVARIGQFPGWSGQDGTFAKETTLGGYPYPFTLVLNGLTMSISDTHGEVNTYGSIRGMEINKK